MRKLSLLADGEPVELHEIDQDEVQQIYDLYRIAYSVQSRKATNRYYKGMTVKFTGRGMLMEGTIERVNTKSVTIRTEAGQRWRVSPIFILD